MRLILDQICFFSQIEPNSVFQDDNKKLPARKCICNIVIKRSYLGLTDDTKSILIEFPLGLRHIVGYQTFHIRCT